MAEKKKHSKAPVSFPKEKLLTFEKYRDRRDLLGALLKDGASYSTAEADAMIKTFLKGAK